MGARGAPARRAVLKARAADMVGREEMDCGMGELAELVLSRCSRLRLRFLPALAPLGYIRVGLSSFIPTTLMADTFTISVLKKFMSNADYSRNLSLILCFRCSNHIANLLGNDQIKISA